MPLACLLLTACQSEQGKKERGDQVQYRTMTVNRSDQTLVSEYSARLTGRQIVEIRPQVSGIITRICINEGQQVTKGQALFVIDQVPYQAALEAAQASVANEAKAALAQAKAQERNARNNLSYTEVKSPVSGSASMIPYHVGALVSSNISEPLVTVADDHEMYAYFSVTENQPIDLIQQYGSIDQFI